MSGVCRRREQKRSEDKRVGVISLEGCSACWSISCQCGCWNLAASSAARLLSDAHTHAHTPQFVAHLWFLGTKSNVRSRQHHSQPILAGFWPLAPTKSLLNWWKALKHELYVYSELQPRDSALRKSVFVGSLWLSQRQSCHPAKPPHSACQARHT